MGKINSINLPTVEVVLKEQELSAVPEEISNLNNVVSLDLSSSDDELTLDKILPLVSPPNSLMQLILSNNATLLSPPPSTSPITFGNASSLLHFDISFCECASSTLSLVLKPLNALLRLDAESCSLSEFPSPLPTMLMILNLKDNEIVEGSLPEREAFPAGLLELDLRENPLVDTTPHYKSTIGSLIPKLQTLDGFSTSVVSADSKPADMKEAVTAGDTLADDTGHLIAENEFNAAMGGKVDNTVVG
jgi:hypothetical protein